MHGILTSCASPAPPPHAAKVSETQPLGRELGRPEPTTAHSYQQLQPTPPPPRSTQYYVPPPYQTYYPGQPQQTTYYQPYPTQEPPHYTYHRSENTYVTIYESNTVYYAPTYIQPTYAQPTFSPYIFPTYVAPIVTGPNGAFPTATQAVNPWADQCPVPYHFWVNDFFSNATFASLTVSYNGGTFLCPNAPSNEITYNGVYDMYCDDDGLVRVITDGQSWITISEYTWCLPIPRPPQDLPTLEAASNYTSFDQAIDCEDNNYGGTVCVQIGQDFAIDVQRFGIGGDIGFEPLDINGNWLPNCPEVDYVEPIVTNTASCTAAPAPSIAGASTTVYSTVSLS
ncbi:hypothetical protein V8E51_005484 [Hyaloscypha variabilis]